MQFHFENHVLDEERRDLTRGSEPVQLEPQVFDLLVYLVRHRNRVVTKDDMIASIWNGRIVSESTIASRINALRMALGDSGKKQRLIRTVARRGIRFVGDVVERVESRAVDTVATASPSEPEMRQEIRFCTAADGVRIAHAAVGRGPPLVKTAHWLTHLEYDWQSPVWIPLLHALAADYRLIRYDARGNGLSDWEVKEFSLEALVRDLESVIDASGLDSFSLFGASQGCAVSIAYAARHPERVDRLVLYGGFARGRRKRGSQQEIATSEAVVTLMRQGWGRENPAFRQLVTSVLMPDGTPEQIQWLNDLQRITTSPENAARLRLAIDDIDVTGLLHQVKAPTLVLHCRDDDSAPFEEGRQIAAGIPGARFVALEGRNHVILKGDPGWSRFLLEIGNFLKR